MNNGTITVAGQATSPTANKGNVLAGPAVDIEGSIAGGFYNGGPLSSTDSTNTPAVISTVSNTEALLITPATTPTTPIDHRRVRKRHDQSGLQLLQSWLDRRHDQPTPVTALLL